MEAYPCVLEYRSRWSDNDQYGHLNNAKYIELFDSITNAFLAPLLANSGQIALIVHTEADYHSSVSFPEIIKVGLGIHKLGKSSVTWKIAVSDADGRVACTGNFVHVFVNSETRKSAPIKAGILKSLKALSAGRSHL